MKETLQKMLAIFAVLLVFLVAWVGGSVLKLKHPDIWIFRIGVTLLGLAIVGLFLLWKARQEGRAKAQSGQPLSGPGAAPVQQLEQLHGEAGGRLAASRLGKGASVSTLPVILVLGDTASAKTTTIVQSGLDPELLAGHAFQDKLVAPTRVVNYWLARQAVVVDPSGQLVADAQARSKLMKLLQARTPKFSGRGQAPRVAVVCVDIEGFLKPGAMEASMALAGRLRGVLGEISQSWGVNLPVYVLFTKLDRLPFFADYVAPMQDQEAQQVVGATLPLATLHQGGLYAQQETARVTEAFHSLFYSLAAHRPEILSRERDPMKLPGSYQFPREFRKLRSIVVPFLVELCRPSQLRANPFLRGMYFTGVRAVIVTDVPAAAAQREQFQEPLLSDATGIFQPGRRGAPDASLQQPTARKVPQWVFLRRIFSDIILADSTALITSGSSTRKNIPRRLLFAGVTVLAFVFAVGWLVSFLNNRALQSEALAAAAAMPVSAGAGDTSIPLRDLERLEALRAVSARLRDYDRYGAPMSYRWGLYSGNKLYPVVRRIYFGHFRSLLLASTQESLLGVISRPEAATGMGYKSVYDALKAYLITTSNPDKSTVGFLPPVLSMHWSKASVVDPKRAELVMRQFRYYAEELPAGNPYPSFSRPNMPAVETARKYLSQFAATETLYQAMLAAAADKQPTLVFNRMYPGSAEVVRNTYPIPGGFTRKGWDFMQQAIANPERFFSGEKWVMGDQAYLSVDREKLRSELQARYRSDFLNKWREFLRSTTIVRYSSIPDASDKLTRITAIQSPLLSFFCMASENTSVDVKEVAEVFQPVQHVTPPGCQEKLSGQSNAAYMDSLIKLQASLQALGGASANEVMRTEAINAATSAQVAARQAAQQFRIDKEGQVHSIAQRLLEDPILMAQSALGNVDKDAINAKGGAACAQLAPLMAKYPFQPKAGARATIEEINAFFQPPNGALWQFYNQHLSKLLIRQGNDFVPVTGGNMQVTPAFLAFFRKVAGISTALYKSDGAPPELNFALRPYPTEGIQSITLAINGKKYTSSGNKSESFAFSWPGAGPQSVALTVKIAGGSELNYPGYNGLWAVFEFFANADRWQASGQEYSLEWTLRTSGGVVTLPKSGKPVSVRFDLNTLGAPPILRPGYLAALSCTSMVVK